ncbi:MAG TPA: hypothetical protein PKV21_02095 [bacterium]|nr:hypothetical protein [bacterium]HOM26281.1 hypothetical protein [bacterium]
MKCKNVEKNILDYIEGKVKEKEKIREHLEKCLKCRNLYKEFLLILNSLPKEEFSGFDENFWKEKFKYIQAKQSLHIKLKPVFAGISLFLIFFSTFLFTRIYTSNLKKVNSTVKIEILNHNLPFSEEEMIEYVDYMQDEEAEKILDVIFKGF